MNKNMQGFFFRDFANSYIPQILQEIYIHRVYEPFLNGKKNLTIVDWGGNIGLASHYFSPFADKVFCVEPAKSHVECIEAMLEQNTITNVKVCNYAISEKNGKEKFYHNTNKTMHSLKDVVNDKNDFEEVETVTPDEFMKREGIEHIDLLKWDTEGNEGEILVSEGFEKIKDKIDVIVGEHHSWSSMNPMQFRNTFIDLGFDFNWYTDTDAAVFSAVRKNLL